MVFWDIEDCAVPEDVNAHTVWKNICSSLVAKGYVQGRFDVIGFGDIVETTSSDFGAAGIRIAHIPEGENDLRRNYILVKLLVEAIGANYDTNFVLLVGDISGHSGFFRALGHLKFRTSNHVILAQPDTVPHKLKRLVTSAWLWSSLLARRGPFFHQFRQRRPKNGRFIPANTVIFWDVVECQIPDGLNAGVVSRNIKSALADCGLVSMDEVVPIYAYGDTRSHLQDLELHDRGVDKDARLEKILVDMLCCVIDQPYTTNLMLILGDISGHEEHLFAANLLRNKNFNVFLALPQN